MKIQKKIEKQKRQKQLNALKRPVSKTERELKQITYSLKHRMTGIIISTLFLLLCLSRMYYDFHIDKWKTETITFQKSWYDSYTLVRGGRVSSYYIADNNKDLFVLKWTDSFDMTLFEDEVKTGDDLLITWYYWLGEKHIRALQSDKTTYRSYSDAVKECKDDGKAVFVITLFVTIIDLVFTFSCFKKLKLKKKLQLQLADAKEKLDIYMKNN